MPNRSVRKPDPSQVQSPDSDKTKVPRAETMRRVEDAAKMISRGKGRNQVIEYLQNKFKMSFDQSRRYYIAAVNFLVPENQEEYRETIIKHNVERLEKIIEETMESKDYKMAKEAIAELNKTMGVGSNKVTVGMKNDPETGENTVIVNFN